MFWGYYYLFLNYSSIPKCVSETYYWKKLLVCTYLKLSLRVPFHSAYLSVIFPSFLGVSTISDSPIYRCTEKNDQRGAAKGKEILEENDKRTLGEEESLVIRPKRTLSLWGLGVSRPGCGGPRLPVCVQDMNQAEAGQRRGGIHVTSRSGPSRVCALFLFTFFACNLYHPASSDPHSLSILSPFP